ncbi:sugar transferase [Lutispora thermophila]|uniref:Exopolysaccharide biosynthesis polyprenyl glycosylphosphotransferase n=1 Tax=Lutispora thermophila DSM 19022 TaxID=1122184 RepID=A0A1M6BX92_9FIRM|nr:exopolysaccharide biosynthesis polyprenyl glycosylphosphotransferase [Lutispora thermophila]SHI53124.1 exopolysaccharide biosynthesis polyprenyl glycosylphosphotransferase [Lutispora thermophila DSM 19022]
MRFQIIVKNILDFIFSLLFLIILLPIFVIIAIVIKLDSKGSAFFIQERVGKDGKLFKVYKFRTMYQNNKQMKIDEYYTEENDPRITRIGRFLRKTSLDELPQLINIIKGEMSFIGPRPTLKYQVDQYNEFQMQRLKMRPGVTGWAQVNGRNSIPWSERIKYDVYYVNNYSLFFDLKILLKTVKVVLSHDGIYGEKENFVIKD